MSGELLPPARSVTNADVKALIVGCLARERRSTDLAARRRMVDIVHAGLRQHPAGTHPTGRG
jgi:hypothetical protein